MQDESPLPIVWELPPGNLCLAPNEIHLWCADLAAQSFVLQILQTLLSEGEQNRAQRFRFSKDQIQYIVAHGLLRIILGRYLQRNPTSLCFGYGAQGKPWLKTEQGEPHSLRFNLAHSEDLILYAVGWRQEVGIDVEHIRAETSYETIAEQFFSPAEIVALRALPFAQQPQAFFNCWTRKEAYIKARGEGLLFPLDAFAVSLDAQAPVALQVNASPAESQRWRLYHLNPKQEYAGALAAEGQQHVLRFHTTRGLNY